MKKRTLALFLTVIMTVTLLPATTLAADSDFIIENGVLTKYKGPGGKVIIPEGVTSIGDSAFNYCKSLTSVTIPDSVTTINWGAFRDCENLTSVTISNSVTTIGEAAFSSCTGLTSVTIPNSVTTIEGSAFFACRGLTSVTIPASVTTIGGYAFCNCESLTSVTIPNSVTAIGERTFEYCTRLTSVTIPDSVTTIGEAAFCGCTGLTSVTIPNSVTTIGQSAFFGCTGLTSVTIPNSVTTIGDYAFCNCKGLTSVTIPNSVTTIGDHAFDLCDSLTVYGYTGTEAEAYCEGCGIPFVTINGSDPSPSPSPEPSPSPSSSGGSSPASEQFADVVKGSWYEPGVTYVVVRGLFQGMAEGVFSPDTNMSRAMVMTVLARMEGQDTTNATNGPWYANIMNWARQRGISDGTMPEDAVTREQLVVMLHRYMGAPEAAIYLSVFTDGGNVSPWATDAMKWAVSEEILTGKDGGRLDPQGFATRAEVATIFQRFVEKTGK